MTEPAASSPGSEHILGEIPVSSRLSVGYERLSIFLTEKRMIVARVGKRSTGSMTSLPMLAIITGGLESLFKWKRDSSRKKKAETSLTPEQILSLDKENFQIGYDEVVSLEVLHSEYRTELRLVTRNEKLSFSTPTPYLKVLDLLRAHLDSSRLSSKQVSE